MERSLYQRNCQLLRLDTAESTSTQLQTSKKKACENKLSRRSFNKSLSPAPSQETQLLFKPAISKRSLRIAANLGDPKLRLLSAKRDKSEGAAEESPSFRPTINRKSSLLISRVRGHTHNQSERWDLLSSVNQSLCNKSCRLLAVDQEEENKQCTFQPKVQGSKLAKGGVVQRLEDWAKAKEEHLRVAVEGSAGKDLHECTFMPVILEVKSTSVPKVTYSNGVEKFLERQRRARIQKEEKQSKSRSKSPILPDLEPPTLLNTQQFPPTEEPQALDFATARLLLHEQLNYL